MYLIVASSQYKYCTLCVCSLLMVMEMMARKKWDQQGWNRDCAKGSVGDQNFSLLINNVLRKVPKSFFLGTFISFVHFIPSRRVVVQLAYIYRQFFHAVCGMQYAVCVVGNVCLLNYWKLLIVGDCFSFSENCSWHCEKIQLNSKPW